MITQFLSTPGLKTVVENDNFSVWNRVRIWRTGRHNPTKNSQEYPPGLDHLYSCEMYKLHNFFSSNSRATGKLYYFTLCTRSFRQGHRRKNQGAFHHLVLDTKLARESVSQTPSDAYYRRPHKKNTNDLHWCYSFLIHKQTGFVLISHQLLKK